MNTPRKHAAMIHAWADGAQIQVRRSSDAEWKDTSSPNWHEAREYRIKPRIEKRRYRVALFVGKGRSSTDTADDIAIANLFGMREDFHSWLTDWVEYEIEAAP